MTNIDPIATLNKTVPCFRKVVKGFKDNGDYWLMLHIYQGGLRSPRIFDAGDKVKVKNGIANLLQAWDKPHYTGQLACLMKHSEFTERLCAYPGAGSFDEYQKEGISLKIESYFDQSQYEHCYTVENKGVIKKKDPLDDVPF